MSPNTISVKLNEGGKSTVKARSVITATRPEVTPFPRPTTAYWLLRNQFQKSSERKDGKVVIATESVKGGKQESVRDYQIPCLPAGS